MSEQSSVPVAELEPANDLERALAAAQNGESTTAEFLHQLIEAEVFILLSQAEKGDDEDDERNIQPLVLEGPEKTPMLAMFTHSDRVSPITKEFPNFAFPYEVEFSWIVANATDGMGLVINPGWSYAASLPPEALAQLRNKGSGT
ncbi:MAG: SseB family protein [Nitrococcus mobilis]|nr:SseB family protein [Nitrococcus mobilis]